MRTTRHFRRSAGYTLTELLLAMGLFSIVGMGLVTLLSRATDFLTMGASSAETMDALQAFSETFGEDVSTLYCVPDTVVGAPWVRLYSDHVDSDIDVELDDQADARIQRLFFTRLIPREATSPMTRTAGTKVEGTAYMDQSADLSESENGELLATGGLQEIFWAAVPEDKSDLAVTRLYRGYRSPIGGDATLFPRSAAGDPGTLPEELGPIHRNQIVSVARPVLSGVLYFGVQFWSRKTTTWDSDTAARNGGPVDTWDSTRGIMPLLSNRARYDGFLFAKGSGSLDDPTDDTFPRRMRVTLVVEEIGAKAKIGYLNEDLPADARYVSLEDARFIPPSDTTRRFVKIGSEWIEFVQTDGNTLTNCKRGARGTVPQLHAADSRVHHGRTIVREFNIPTFRDTYADDLPAVGGRMR